MRNKIIAANWKMNLLFPEAEELIGNIIESVGSELTDFVQIIICPPFPYLELAVELTHETGILIGAQNVHQLDKGAYTGEVSAPMLKSLMVDCCIVGHSERRKYFSESDELLHDKVKSLLNHDITPIFCCGESLDEREKGNHFQVVKNQLVNSIFLLSKTDFQRIIIAYEPVWAIGTGVNATPEQADEMHAFIRELIMNVYDEITSANTSILYGGSCNSKNAAELFQKPNIDGGLIGGASLTLEEFLKIIKAIQIK
jgi:triosephosphate isomerase